MLKMYFFKLFIYICLILKNISFLQTFHSLIFVSFYFEIWVVATKIELVDVFNKSALKKMHEMVKIDQFPLAQNLLTSKPQA